MSREAIGRTVVRPYPKDIRESGGRELAGTLLDVGEASRGGYVRRLVSLARSGWSARAHSELILVLFTLRRNRTTRDSRPGLARDPCPVHAAAQQNHPGFSAWPGSRSFHQHSMLPLSGFFESIPLQAAGFALLAIKPRKPLPAGRFLWPAPAIVWLLYQVTLLGQQSGVGRITPASPPYYFCRGRRR
jgi:hypothetical protein